jgi:hypothetical protein
MTDSALKHCVLVPCSETERWAVPQNCLGEIQVVNSDTGSPPESISWRGREVPVLDFGPEDSTPWCESRNGTGLVAIFLGLKGDDCEYWGVAVRGNGLTVTSLSSDDIGDASDRVADHASAAFEYHGVLYQVPDLDGLQKRVAVNRDNA